jgi:hypothetical protein
LPIHRLIYHSQSRLPSGEAALRELRYILNVSLARNSALGITGVLYHDGVGFTQVLEGSRAAVAAVFDDIAEDPRHAHVTVLAAASHPHRDFAGWSMALVTDADMRLLADHAEKLPGLDGGRMSGFLPTMASVLAWRRSGLAVPGDAHTQGRP